MIISIEDRLLLDGSPSSSGIKDIIKVRKDILKVKRYYEHMEFLTDEMAGVDPSFGFISHKFSKLMDFVCELQGHIESVREAYQSQIDIEQNNIMKFFTVVTTIFTPLTLVTGWYGMNFNIPECSWPFGYAYVIGLSLLVVVVLIVIFRRKGWF
jgi:magnesium transporter